MKTIDAVAPLRPRPSGPPLRGRAPLRDGITDRRLAGHNDTEQGTADSTLNPPSRGRRLGVGAILVEVQPQNPRNSNSCRNQNRSECMPHL